MGSLNVTCFASGQTIADHDKCRVLPITQNSTFSPIVLTKDDQVEKLHGIANSFCYPDAFWVPMVGFLPGTYSDSFEVKLQLDALGYSNLLSFFNILLRSPKAAANEYGRGAFDFHGFLEQNTPALLAHMKGKRERYLDGIHSDASGLAAECTKAWTYVWATVHSEHSVFGSSYRGTRPIEFAIIHEETYLELVRRGKSNIGWREQSMQPKDCLQRWVTEAHARAEDMCKTDEEQRMKAFFFSDAMRESLRSLDSGNRAWPGIVESQQLFADTAQLMAGKLTEEQFIERAEPLLDDRYAASMLDHLGIRYSPIVTCGQDYHNDVGRSYAQFVGTVSVAVSRRREEDKYGPFSSFTVRAAKLEDFELAVKDINQWDAAVRDITTKPAEYGVDVAFSCTLPVGMLRDYLKEQNNLGINVKSLAATPA